MPFDDDTYKPRLREEILFWLCVPFLIAFVFLLVIPFYGFHLIEKYILKRKMTLWEWFGQEEIEMFGIQDYDNDDEIMFHGKPSDYDDKDK